MQPGLGAGAVAQCRGMQEQVVGTHPASFTPLPVPQRCSLAVVLSPRPDCSRARRRLPWAVAFNNSFLEMKAQGVCARSFLPQHGLKEPGAGRAACVPAPGFPGDSAARQLCPYPWAAGEHLEGVMALPLVVRQLRSPGAMACRAGRREARCKVLQGTSLSPGAGLSSQRPPLPGRMARGEFAAGAATLPWLAAHIVSWLP